MKKILIVIDSMYGGGAERVASRIANALAVDHEVVIYTRYTPETYPLAENIKILNYPEPPSLYPIYKRGARFMRLPNKIVRYYRLIKMCEEVKRKFKPDVTLSMLSTQNLMNAFSKGSGRRVLSERNNPLNKDSEYRFLGKISFKRADRVVFQTETHNIDDGFDCYTKDIIGPISPVRFIDCEAWNNGWLSEETKPRDAKRSGSGFKLGGERIKVAHVLVNCISHHNARRGFHYNSNPAPILKGCREWKNLLQK